MTYDLARILPASYHEKLAAKNVAATDHVLSFVNAISIHNCHVITDEIVQTEGRAYPVDLSSNEPDDPGLVVMFGHVLCNDDGTFTMMSGTPRQEIVAYIDKMYSYFADGDANSAFAVMNLLSNSTKNVLSENLMTTKVKSQSQVVIKPCSL